MYVWKIKQKYLQILSDLYTDNLKVTRQPAEALWQHVTESPIRHSSFVLVKWK